MERPERPPVVAGTFYPADPKELNAVIQNCFAHRRGSVRGEAGEGDLLGVVVPHAGYVYSGAVAASAYAALQGASPEVAVLLGPNHRGWGPAVSVWDGGDWQTPLGKFPIDRAAMETIFAEAPSAQPDRLAHSAEHSLEVQLPFLRHCCGEVSIVAISVREMALSTAQELGRAIAGALAGRRGVVIASSDFTHYEPQAVAEAQDARALEAIVRMDAAGLEQVVEQHQISMCGPGPIMATLEACVALGATRAERLAYATSGDVTGDPRSVVGYAAVAIRR